MSEAAYKPVENEFDQIAEAVAGTPRGRWFLREFQRRNRQADTMMILKALETFKDTLSEKKEEGRIEILRAELQKMAQTIDETRSDIASMKTDDAASDRIEAATGELDAIISATEKATSDILEAAEDLQVISEKIRETGGSDEICDEIEMHTTNIFTACSFQDVTGQRTTKVVKTLHYLEQRVNAMIEIWGNETAEGKAAPIGMAEDVRPDALILNGPQMDDEAFSQEDIDALLDGDFSAIGDADLDAAHEKAEAVEKAIDNKEDGPVAASPVETSADDDDPEDDGEVGLEQEIDQDDIDSLFG